MADVDQIRDELNLRLNNKKNGNLSSEPKSKEESRVGDTVQFNSTETLNRDCRKEGEEEPTAFNKASAESSAEQFEAIRRNVEERLSSRRHTLKQAVSGKRLLTQTPLSPNLSMKKTELTASLKSVSSRSNSVPRNRGKDPQMKKSPQVVSSPVEGRGRSISAPRQRKNFIAGGEPWLETWWRLGDKPGRKKVEVEVPTTPKREFRKRLTEPEPFNLSYIPRLTHTRRKKADPPMAEMLNAYLEKGGLREVGTSSNFDGELTIPKPFNLSQTRQTWRKNPIKSRNEIEEEELAYRAMHQFKARPVGVRRESTVPLPHQLESDEIEMMKTPPPTTEEAQVAEGTEQLHDLTIPDLAHESPSQSGDMFHKKHLIQPQPLTSNFIEKHESETVTTEDKVEIKKTSRAKPLPALIYRSPSPSRKKKLNQTASGSIDMNSVGIKVRTSTPQRTRDGRAITVPEPFNLHCVVRHEIETAKPSQITEDEVEMMRKFRAKPLPASIYRSPSPSRKKKSNQTPVSRPGITIPEPFHLQSVERSVAHRLQLEAQYRELEKEKLKMAEGFRARPLPQSSNELRSRSRTRMKSLSNDQRVQIISESEQKIEMISSNPSRARVTVPQPFYLHSVDRSAAHRAQLDAQRRKEKEEERRMSVAFRAKPVPQRRSRSQPRTNRRSTERSDFQITTPEPFKLLSLERHLASQQNMAVRLELEEHDRAMSTRVKANPVPRTTYLPSPTRRRNQGSNHETFQRPELRTASRAKSRREYIKSVQKSTENYERLKEVERQEREVQDEMKVKNLRRRPAGEGGFAFKARPFTPERTGQKRSNKR